MPTDTSRRWSFGWTRAISGWCWRRSKRAADAAWSTPTRRPASRERAEMLPLLLMCFAATGDPPQTPASIEEEGLRQLLTVRRVFVDRLTGGETAAQMRDILIGSLQAARLFIVTENQERADAILRGASEDLVFTDVHSS